MVKLFGIYDKKSSNKVLKNQIIRMHKAVNIGSLDYECRDYYAVGHERIPTKNTKGIAKNDDVIVCLSGRIYDYEDDLKHLKNKGYKLLDESAEEFILASYMEYGLDFVTRLNGKFVIVIYDDRYNSVYVVNDRFGMKPLYYYVDKTKFVFGSEIKAILTNKRVLREIDWSFWKDLFAYRFQLGTKTPYKEIKSLPNATILTYKNGKCTLNKYWDYDQIKINYSRSKEDTIREGVQVLKRVFIRQTKDLKECMVMLSGGYDSRCIVSSIKRFTDVDIHVYSLAKSYYVPQKSSGDLDTKYSQQVCNKLNVKYTIVGNHPNIYKNHFIHHLMLLDGITSESLWVMPLLDEINTDRVNFDGLLGDIFLRSGWLAIPSIANPRRSLKQYAENLHQQMIMESEIDSELICSFFDDDVKNKIWPDSDEVKKELSTIPEIPYRIKIFHLKNTSRNMHMLISGNVIARKTDTIYPFCDNEFAEFAFSIPPKMKIDNNIYFQILSKAFPDVMKVPTTNDAKNIKERLQKKFGNVGLTSLVHTVRNVKKNFYKIFKTSNKTMIARSLSKSPRDVMYLVKLANTMNMPKYINKKLLLKRIDEHIKIDRDPSYFLEPIIHFCVWHNQIYKK